MILVLKRKDGSERIFELSEGSNMVGRWDPNTAAYPEIDLDQEDTDAKVSRKHAVINWQNGRVSIQDVGSLNGTFLNHNLRLEPDQRYELSPGDEITIGKLVFKFKA